MKKNEEQNKDGNGIPTTIKFSEDTLDIINKNYNGFTRVNLLEKTIWEIQLYSSTYNFLKKYHIPSENKLAHEILTDFVNFIKRTEELKEGKNKDDT